MLDYAWGWFGSYVGLATQYIYSWDSTGKIGRIGRHLAEKPDVEVTMCLGPMQPDASDLVELQL